VTGNGVPPLNIETEIQADHQARIRVEVEPEVFDRIKRRSAKKISKRTKIPGFRPGKAPFPVVQRHVGEAAILEEALDMLIDDIYPQVIEQSEVQPYGPGTLEDLESTDPPILQFLVPLAPDVELGDYHSIEYPYEPPVVEDQEIQDVLKQVQENQAIIEPVERAAEEGDIVYVRVSGTEIVAEGDPETTGETVPERRLNILIDPETSEADQAWPYSGFSKELIGLSAGDSKKLEHAYPEEGDFQTFAGKTIQFEIKIDEVKSRELPELDDELAQSLGDYEDLEALTTYVSETLLHNKTHEYHDEYDDQVIEDLLGTSTIKYPPQMLANEIKVMTDQLSDQLGSQGLDLATYLKTQDLDEAGLEEEFRPRAESRIKRGLILFEVANAEKIEVTPEEVQEEVSQTIGQLMQMMPEDEARRRLSGDAVQNLVSQIMSDKLAQRAGERLRAIASGGVSEVDEVEEDNAEAVELDTAVSSVDVTAEGDDTVASATEEAEEEVKSKEDETASSEVQAEAESEETPETEDLG
jgi:trigger factor